MVDPATPNLQLFTPANGADPGSWDVPANANWSQLDAVLGTNVSIPLSNLPITLSAGQYNNSLIIFTGTLTGNVTVTFPQFGRLWRIFNNCLGGATFSVICKTAISTVYVAVPPGEVSEIICDGTNIRFNGGDHVGTYLDMAATSVPVWITASVPQPYLNCDGTSFSSATYPNLRDYLGTNVLPDSKGRFRATLGQGSGRLTGIAGSGGLDGTTFLAGGGSQTIVQGNIPNYGLPAHFHIMSGALGTPAPLSVGGPNNVGGPLGNPGDFGIQATPLDTDLATVNSGGSGNPHAPPSYVGGLTLIRAG